MVKRSISNIEIGRQLVRAAGSVGANYIEANESLGEKDIVMRIRICRKEGKESAYWLRLLGCGCNEKNVRDVLLQGAREPTTIFGAILEKTKDQQ